MEKKIPLNIVTDSDGKRLVLINDVRFRSRRKLDWDNIEAFLKEYIGKCYEIQDTSERVYIGADSPDEFSHSMNTKGLKGANEKAKANFIYMIL